MTRLLTSAMLILALLGFTMSPTSHLDRKSEPAASLTDESEFQLRNEVQPSNTSQSNLIQAYYILNSWVCYGDCEGTVCCEVVIVPN